MCVGCLLGPQLATTDERVDLKVAENLVQTWRSAALLKDEPLEPVSGITQSKPWRFEQYTDDKGGVRLGYLTVDDIEHGWIGGNPGKYSTPAAPNVSELIWAFFNRSDSAMLHSEAIIDSLNRKSGTALEPERRVHAMNQSISEQMADRA